MIYDPNCKLCNTVSKCIDNLYISFQYMEQLLMEGENMEFFVEGGRSRTGKALQPKGGLLSVVLDSVSSGMYLQIDL